MKGYLAMLIYLGACYYLSYELKSMMDLFTPPEKLIGTCLILYYDKILAVGGKSQEKNYMSLWEYNTDYHFWKRLDLPTSLLPSKRYLGPRFDALCNLISNTTFLFFGGKDSYGFTSDIWIFRPAARTFYLMGTPKVLLGLSEYGSCSISESLYVYGGKTYSKYSYDIFR